MQTFIGVVGMQPLHMVAAASDDPRRVNEFPAELVEHLSRMMEAGLRPRDIVVRDSLRNAMIVNDAQNRIGSAPQDRRDTGLSLFGAAIVERMLAVGVGVGPIRSGMASSGLETRTRSRCGRTA